MLKQEHIVHNSKMSLNQKRVGRFEIARYLINEKPEIIKQILGKCVVIRAEMMFQKDAIEYIAFCDEFDEVGIGSSPPLYDVVVSERKNNSIEIEFERKE